MDEQQTQHSDVTRKWGQFFGFLAGGIFLGFAVGEPGALGLLGAIVGVVAALSSRKTSVPRHLSEVGAFVRSAYRDGDIDTDAYERLADRLRSQGFWMAPAAQVVPEAEQQAPIAASSTAVATAPARPPSAPPSFVPTPPRPAAKPPVTASRPAAPPPVKPPATPSRPPTRPKPVSDRHPVPAPTPRQAPTFLRTILAPIQRFWQALAGDFAVQGLGSLGVLLVFTATLGFVFFAFTSVGVAYRPIAEVLVPVVLFGMAAFLRRRNARFMAAAVEFLGGAVTPVMVFAAIVDGSAFLPDLERGSLIAALATAALAMATGYGWIVHRRPTSPLRFLVAPLVWSAVGVVGLVFHEGASAAQMALVVGAVAATAWVVKLRSGGALADATRLMAPFGLVVAYALLLVFALAEEWPLGPMVAGASAAIAAAEAMRSVVSRAWLVEAAVVVGTAAAATVTVEPAWVGVVATATFLALAERWAIAGEDDAELAVRVLGGAALAGAFVAIWQPEPLIAVSGLVTVLGQPAALSAAAGSRTGDRRGRRHRTGGDCGWARVAGRCADCRARRRSGRACGVARGSFDRPCRRLLSDVGRWGRGARCWRGSRRLARPRRRLSVGCRRRHGGRCRSTSPESGRCSSSGPQLPSPTGDGSCWPRRRNSAATCAPLSSRQPDSASCLPACLVPERNGGQRRRRRPRRGSFRICLRPQSWWLIGVLAGWTAGWVAEVVTEDRSPLQRLGGAEVSASDLGWVQATVLAVSVPVLAAFTALEIWPDADFVALTWTAGLLGVGYAAFAGFVTIRPRLGEVAAVGSIILTLAAVGVASRRVRCDGGVRPSHPDGCLGLRHRRRRTGRRAPPPVDALVRLVPVLAADSCRCDGARPGGSGCVLGPDWVGRRSVDWVAGHGRDPLRDPADPHRDA